MSDIDGEPEQWPAGSAHPVPTDTPGVYLYGEAHERIVRGLRRSIEALAAGEQPTRWALPPVVSRRTIERTGYPASFPHLLGTVHSFAGDAKAWSALAPLVASGGDWQVGHRGSDLVLLPAACYPVYAALSGQTLVEPVTHVVEGHCFRQEATSETGRLRSFRMLEVVTAGDAGHCAGWRDRWLDRMAGWLTGLAVKAVVEPADDPFFGSARKLYQAAQRAQRLKFELRAPVAGDLVQAVASANWHKDHFGTVFGISAGDAAAHTACVGFGLERLALALIDAHGPVPARWPVSVLARLG